MSFQDNLVTSYTTKIKWVVPGIASLVIFSIFLTRVETVFAGRTAAYDGVYIAASLLWLWLIERQSGQMEYPR